MEFLGSAHVSVCETNLQHTIYEPTGEILLLKRRPLASLEVSMAHL